MRVALLLSMLISFGATSCDRQVPPLAPPPPKFDEIHPNDIAGCYELTMTPWNPPLRDDGESWYRPPARFELTLDEIGPTRLPPYRIRPMNPDPAHNFTPDGSSPDRRKRLSAGVRDSSASRWS